MVGGVPIVSMLLSVSNVWNSTLVVALLIVVDAAVDSH